MSRLKIFSGLEKQWVTDAPLTKTMHTVHHKTSYVKPEIVEYQNLKIHEGVIKESGVP